MAKAETYTVTQSAKILGLSVKRVRQLLQEGKLNAHTLGPVKIKQTDILNLRNQREAQGKSVKVEKSQEAVNASVLVALQGLSDTFTRQLEMVTDSNKRNEENLIGQIQQLQAEIATLRARRSLFKRK